MIPPYQDGPEELEIGALLHQVYPELRRFARSRMDARWAGATMQPTAVVHEAVLKLLRLDRMRFASREHFVSVAVVAIERTLASYARRRLALKRKGIQLPDSAAELRAVEPKLEEIVLVSQILEGLKSIDERAHRVFQFRFFGALTSQEVAGLIGISVATADRDWKFARLWIYDQLRS